MIQTKKGIEPTYKATCEVCQSEYKFKFHEIVIGPTVKYIECQECKTWILSKNFKEIND